MNMPLFKYLKIEKQLDGSHRTNFKTKEMVLLDGEVDNGAVFLDEEGIFGESFDADDEIRG